MFEIKEYNSSLENELLLFLQKCLPESGRCLDIDGRHSYYKDISGHFRYFGCLFDNGELIGSAAVAELGKDECELKSLYLYEKYHGQGLGKRLLMCAIEEAKKLGYKTMYLDSLSTSTRAIALYRRMGFKDTEKYRSVLRSDVFMKRDISSDNREILCFDDYQ